MIKEWIILICFLSITAFIVNSLLPSGKMKEICTLIFSLISIILILQPIQGFKDFSFDFEFESIKNAYSYNTNFEIDDNYISEYYYGLAKIELSKSGIDLKSIRFEFDDKNNQKNLKKIYINYSDLVIIDNSSHINITMIAKQRLSYLFLISQDDVIINENK